MFEYIFARILFSIFILFKIDFVDSLDEDEEKKVNSRNPFSNLSRYEEEYSFH